MNLAAIYRQANPQETTCQSCGASLAVRCAKKPSREHPRGVFEVLIKGEGWQVAADANDAGQMYPDQSLYPAHSVPLLVKRINGTLDGPFVWSAGKLAAVKDWAVRHGIDLAESYAYSDSVYDTPLLSAVGNPFVVNPDPRMALMAAARRSVREGSDLCRRNRTN